MCGAGDNSMNHPDYCDWVRFVNISVNASIILSARRVISYMYTFQISCDKCKAWTHAYCVNMTIAEAKEKCFYCLECFQTSNNIEHFIHN